MAIASPVTAAATTTASFFAAAGIGRLGPVLPAAEYIRVGDFHRPGAPGTGDSDPGCELYCPAVYRGLLLFHRDRIDSAAAVFHAAARSASASTGLVARPPSHRQNLADKRCRAGRRINHPAPARPAVGPRQPAPQHDRDRRPERGQIPDARPDADHKRCAQTHRVAR